MGFGKNGGWEMGLVTPLQDPLPGVGGHDVALGFDCISFPVGGE